MQENKNKTDEKFTDTYVEYIRKLEERRAKDFSKFSVKSHQRQVTFGDK
jgi:hypothetical protein